MRCTFLFSLLASLLAQGATIDQYLGAPFASEMHAAPGGGKVVWLLNERGARNLWVAAAPEYKGRRLTAYKGDDGQDVGMTQWTTDGRSIVYVRGGNLEQIGQAIPNALSLAQMRINPSGSFRSRAARRRNLPKVMLRRQRKTGMWPLFAQGRSG
jgi:hypothetical protein